MSLNWDGVSRGRLFLSSTRSEPGIREKIGQVDHQVEWALRGIGTPSEYGTQVRIAISERLRRACSFLPRASAVRLWLPSECAPCRLATYHPVHLQKHDRCFSPFPCGCLRLGGSYSQLSCGRRGMNLLESWRDKPSLYRSTNPTILAWGCLL